MRLFSFERRWLHQVAVTIFPSGAHPDLEDGVADFDLEPFWDDILARLPGRARLVLRAALWAIQLAPLWYRLAWRPFSRLDGRGRLETLTRLKSSRRYLAREMVLLLKAVGALGFCGLPDIQRSVGIEQAETTRPPWMGEEAT